MAFTKGRVSLIGVDSVDILVDSEGISCRRVGAYAM